MNTANFRSTLNSSACRIEDDMRAICGMGKTFSELLKPLTAAEQAQMFGLIAIEGRGSGLSATQKNTLDFLIRRWVANGGADPRAPDPAALQKQIDMCLVTVQTVKRIPGSAEEGGEDLLDPLWENQRTICRKFLLDNGVSIPGEEGPAAPTAAGSFELITISDLKFIYRKIINLFNN